MRQIKILSILLTALVGMVSCSTDTTSEVTLYGDAAITGFTLGTMNRYTVTQKSDGTDSIVKKTFAGSAYVFNIDQINRLVYNNDSLPVGTDAAHVLVTVSTLNNGVAVIRDTTEVEQWLYVNSTDSIDFTKPRIIRIYASDGSGYNAYTVKVNVHKQEGDVFKWELMDNSWTPPVADAPVLPQGISKILGQCTSEQYALSDDGRMMVSSDKGATWQEDRLDDSATLLPTSDITMVSYPLYLADSTDYVLMAGLRADSEKAMVWRKIVDYSKGAPASQWSYMERPADGLYLLPKMAGLSLVRYDDSVLAFGGDYTKVYQSRDNGITWKENKYYQMPEGFDTSATAVKVTVDDNNYIWLHCEGTGQVWRGRLNRLGWAIQK